MEDEIENGDQMTIIWTKRFPGNPIGSSCVNVCIRSLLLRAFFIRSNRGQVPSVSTNETMEELLCCDRLAPVLLRGTIFFPSLWFLSRAIDPHDR